MVLASEQQRHRHEGLDWDYEKYLTAAGVPPEFHAEAIASLKKARVLGKTVAPLQMVCPLGYGLGGATPAVGGGPFIVRRNVGWKINNVLHNQHTTANVTWITWSLLRWKGE